MELRYSWIIFNFLIFVAISDAAAAVKFEKKQIYVGKHLLSVEVADTEERRARGLMFRKTLNVGEGMLFIFPKEERLSFWMKNTLIPLSIGFFDKNKRLVDVQNMQPAPSLIVDEGRLPNYTSKELSQYALEVPLGWFQQNKIDPGVVFKWAKPSKSRPKTSESKQND